MYFPNAIASLHGSSCLMSCCGTHDVSLASGGQHDRLSRRTRACASLGSSTMQLSQVHMRTAAHAVTLLIGDVPQAVASMLRMFQ